VTNACTPLMTLWILRTTSGSCAGTGVEQRRATRGMTLVELVAAVTLSSLIAAMIIAAWQAIDRHIYAGSRRMMVQMEALRLGESICSRLRKSQRVLDWHANGISCIAGGGKDTVTFELGEGAVLQSGVAMPLAVPRARVSDFSVAVEESGQGVIGPAQLFNLTIEVDDGAGKTYRISRLILLPAPDSRGW